MLRISDANPYRDRSSVPWHWLPIWACAWCAVRGVVYEADVSYDGDLVEVQRLGGSSPYYASIVSAILQARIDPVEGEILR